MEAETVPKTSSINVMSESNNEQVGIVDNDKIRLLQRI